MGIIFSSQAHRCAVDSVGLQGPQGALSVLRMHLNALRSPLADNNSDTSESDFLSMTVTDDGEAAKVGSYKKKSSFTDKARGVKAEQG